jgi:hypothetical protein
MAYLIRTTPNSRPKHLLLDRPRQCRTRRAYNEGSINDLEGNQIMLLRAFGHLGVLALNANRASARNIKRDRFRLFR